jgi:hypothetical protein
MRAVGDALQNTKAKAVAARGRLSRAALPALLALAAVGAGMQTPPRAPVGAQSTAPHDTVRSRQTGDAAPRTVSGRIMRPGGDSVVPVPGIWVVIHRVGSDTAAPLDSTRSSRDGRYAFRYRTFGDPNAIYFVSASYDGIAYFSEPLTTRVGSGPDAEITLFDTTTAPIPLHVRGRHIVIASPRIDGTREMMEVYELSNDTTVTRVSVDDAHPTWSTILPDDLTEFQAGQSDISPQALRVNAGELAVVAPFAPGLKQISFSFRLPASDFPLSIPLRHGASVLEVLLEEPAARVSGARLQQVPNVSVQGRTFTRYLAQDVPANAVARIVVPEVTPPRKPIYLAAVAIAIGAAMLVALAMTFARRSRRAVPAGPVLAPAREDPDQVAGAIARLDSAFEGRADASAADRAAYEQTRAALKQRLAAALAARQHAE